MIFSNLCYYFLGQRCCCAKTSIGNDFVFLKFPLPSALWRPYRCLESLVALGGQRGCGRDDFAWPRLPTPALVRIKIQATNPLQTVSTLFWISCHCCEEVTTIHLTTAFRKSFYSPIAPHIYVMYNTNRNNLT